MIKIVFFDVDGTLISIKTRNIPDSTKKAIKALREKGILCFIATGRHPNNTKGIGLEELEFDGILGLNGQMAVDKDGKVLYSVSLDKADQKVIVDNFNKREHSIVIVEKDRQYFNYLDSSALNFRKKFKLPPPEIGEYQGGEILQGIAYINEADEAAFMSQFKNAKSARWNTNGFDIINGSGGKDVGIKKLLDILNIKAEETMAFGDNHNDKEMLELVNIGVAMGNSIPELKEIADYVSDEVDDDGIYNALKHFNLI